VDDGERPWSVFEFYRADEGLQVCLPQEAEAEAVLVTVIEPTDLDGEAAVSEFIRRMKRAAARSRVTFGFVRRLPSRRAA
jgi:hypothetical protein